MRFSSLLVASPAVANTPIALLLCGLSGTAMSQTATGSAAPLPTITVEAPKHVARPQKPEQRAIGRGTVSARTSVTTQTPSSTAGTPSGAPGPIMRRIAKLEKSASSCNGGCETSFRTGNAPWIGCNQSTGGTVNTIFSATCTDTLTYKNFGDCMETKQFLGLDLRRAWWLCTSLAAGGKFQVAEISRSRPPR
jgi:hypothetical protein